VRIITVVIADHNEHNRASYLNRLKLESAVRVVGEAGTSQEVIKAMTLRPHILLLDSQIMLVSVVPLLPTIRLFSPKTRVILLAGRYTQQQIADAILQGARGVLGKRLVNTYVGKAIRLVNEGEVWIARTMVPLLLPLIGRIGPTQTRRGGALGEGPRRVKFGRRNERRPANPTARRHP
jgi:two-component system, NarL family, nitrate/nitrite response regulator NarL